MADVNKFQEEREEGCKSVMNKHKYASLSSLNSRQMGNLFSNVNNSMSLLDQNLKQIEKES